MRISDWSSDVCSSDLLLTGLVDEAHVRRLDQVVYARSLAGRRLGNPWPCYRPLLLLVVAMRAVIRCILPYGDYAVAPPCRHGASPPRPSVYGSPLPAQEFPAFGRRAAGGRQIGRAHV